MARHLIPPFLFLTILCLAVSVTARPSSQDPALKTPASTLIKNQDHLGAEATGQQNVSRTFPEAATDPDNGGKAGSNLASSFAPSCHGSYTCLQLFQSENFVNVVQSIDMSIGKGSHCWNVNPHVPVRSLKILWKPMGNQPVITHPSTRVRSF